MQNNTLQQYKNAIRKKYEIEKEGKYFDYLYKPSRGKLRDLCWLIFENNPTKEDLNVFSNLLGLDFDHTKKNKFKEKKDKFRPIETFFKGETDPSNIDAINMAAILVDFELRPFKKFYENSKTEKAKPIERMEKVKAVFEKKSAEKKSKKRSFFLDFKSLFF
ncbi:hypothetical protein SAMN06265349_103279 [Flavobacterium resistens]|uniref:Uncharacterized protein n=1 Tax=Flavobacterium resistens TaxID=443612 RepID=A0A521DHX6_9FLAO|nr:hypothetical protein [Flavobacterium resistens]MRX68737.1 hypothetical protein [Flavobacterium resistens]SMO71313.1 hypothetical protein SAMN06265349_103279 [Flavobacterium resistens]